MARQRLDQLAQSLTATNRNGSPRPTIVSPIPSVPAPAIDAQEAFFQIMAQGGAMPDNSVELHMADDLPHYIGERQFELNAFGVPRIVSADRKLRLPCGCFSNPAGVCPFCDEQVCHSHYEPCCSLCFQPCCVHCWTGYRGKAVHQHHMSILHPFRRHHNRTWMKLQREDSL